MTTLSPREREVTRRRVGGESFKAIAADLGLPIGTLSGYQERALAKLGVGTLAEAEVLAENLLALFRQTPDGAPVMLARLTREDVRELRTAFAGIVRGIASATAVLDRLEEATK